MDDFSYPPMSKDMSKSGSSFYTSELSSFARPNPPVNNKSNIFPQPQEYDQWRSNSLPTHMNISTPPIATNMGNFNTNNNSNNPETNPISCDLQDVIVYYQSQPELLRLILMSKVEEDKRRTEEAKLKAKELDMLLAQQQQQLTNGTPQTSDTSIMPVSTSMVSNNNSTTMSNSSNTNCHNNNNNLLNTNQFGDSPRRPSALEMLMEDTDCDRRDSALGSSFDGSPNSGELDDRAFSPTSSSAAASMLSLSFPPQPMMNVQEPRNSLHPLSPPYNMSQSLEDSNSFGSSMYNTTLPGQQQDSRRLDPYFPQRPRRRREMQSISKIVETREYPYVDGFFWKNNGNTTQKKTGNKSVYYKCSNSTKGCPVNKTVTWRENGEYLIKYRGEHLAYCGKVQRIIDM